MKKRILSMLLVLCMLFTLFPTASFAEEASNITIGTPKVCENHNTHNEDCGYSSSVRSNEATLSGAEYDCDHSDDCGHAESVMGADCTHECELCKEAQKLMLSSNLSPNISTRGEL